MGPDRTALRVLVSRLGGKRPVERSRGRWAGKVISDVCDLEKWQKNGVVAADRVR